VEAGTTVGAKRLTIDSGGLVSFDRGGFINPATTNGLMAFARPGFVL